MDQITKDEMIDTTLHGYVKNKAIDSIGKPKTTEFDGPAQVGSFNAAKYGIGKNGNRGRIIVRSYERRDSYAIQIVDEGAGFDTDMLYHKDTPTSMKTVRQRLEASVGGVIEVNSRYGVGTIVTVKVPKKQQSNRNLVEG